MIANPYPTLRARRLMVDVLELLTAYYRDRPFHIADAARMLSEARGLTDNGARLQLGKLARRDMIRQTGERFREYRVSAALPPRRRGRLSEPFYPAGGGV